MNRRTASCLAAVIAVSGLCAATALTAFASTTPEVVSGVIIVDEFTSSGGTCLADHDITTESVPQTWVAFTCNLAYRANLENDSPMAIQASVPGLPLITIPAHGTVATSIPENSEITFYIPAGD
jgi:hypothetical protein